MLRLNWQHYQSKISDIKEKLHWVHFCLRSIGFGFCTPHPKMVSCRLPRYENGPKEWVKGLVGAGVPRWYFLHCVFSSFLPLWKLVGPQVITLGTSPQIACERGCIFASVVCCLFVCLSHCLLGALGVQSVKGLELVGARVSPNDNPLRTGGTPPAAAHWTPRTPFNHLRGSEKYTWQN